MDFTNDNYWTAEAYTWYILGFIGVLALIVYLTLVIYKLAKIQIQKKNSPVTKEIDFIYTPNGSIANRSCPRFNSTRLLTQTVEYPIRREIDLIRGSIESVDNLPVHNSTIDRSNTVVIEISNPYIPNVEYPPSYKT